jgi:hypothetical protein
MSTEEWRWVVGSETHEVSSLGRVRTWVDRLGWRLKRPRLVRPRPMAAYLMVSVRLADGKPAQLSKPVSRYVHRLVLEAFEGLCPEGFQACHFPDRASPRRENLRWDTRAENARDQSAHSRGLAATLERLEQLRERFPHLRAAPDLEVAMRRRSPRARQRDEVDAQLARIHAKRRSAA